LSSPTGIDGVKQKSRLHPPVQPGLMVLIACGGWVAGRRSLLTPAVAQIAFGV